MTAHDEVTGYWNSDKSDVCRDASGASAQASKFRDAADLIESFIEPSAERDAIVTDLRAEHDRLRQVARDAWARWESMEYEWRWETA